jgi:hypothetical protein
MKYFLEKIVLGNAPLSQTPEVSPETAQQYTACPRAVGLGGASPTNKPKRGERETLNLRRRPTRLEKTRSPHRKPKHLPARGVSDSYSWYAFRLSAFRDWIAKSCAQSGNSFAFDLISRAKFALGTPHRVHFGHAVGANANVVGPVLAGRKALRERERRQKECTGGAQETNSA